ncbi:MAG: ATP-grasp domain-containing protein [Gammaproteobacteria bacterium]|nr:ATP-grasp domain-containing protein [Gammaproteobacteria bacterium]
MAPSGSYRIAAYSSAAQALGSPILVVSNSEHSLVADIANGITVDFEQPEAALEIVLQAIENKPVACVLATDDSCVELCSRIADRLNLPHNKTDSAELTHRKDLGRAALARAGCNTPLFQLITIEGLDPAKLTVPYPVVIKPLGLAASRGVIRANDDAEFIAACRRIDAILESTGISGFSRQHLLVESYIDGPEYAVEGFVVEGEFRLLTIFDKPEPLTGPFFEETYYLTPTRLEVGAQQLLIDEIAKCCHAYGLEQGPVHAEARLSAEGPVLLELAARTIGGQCGQLIEFSLQQKLEELVIQGMCGITPETGERAESAGVLMIPITDAGILKRVEGLTEAMQTEFVKDIEIHINPGYELIPLPEGASYLGFIFAQAPDFEQTHAALKCAYRKLRFVTQPKWALENLAG